jgi:hypothetical protein
VRTVKRVLWRERLRRVPKQFSWVDQRVVQDGYVDRCSARALALYLFLVTVADSDGLSYYGESTLAQRLHLSSEEVHAARRQLIEVQLIAWQAPLYQVLALPESNPASTAAPPAPTLDRAAVAAQLRQLREQMERRRGRL